MSTKSAEVSSKLVCPFRAEDFGTDDPCEVLRLGTQENRAAVQLANALLAPLWEALAQLDYAYWVLDRDPAEYIEAVSNAYRALQDREEK